MQPGDTETLGKYTFKYIGVNEESFSDRLEETAEFKVWSGDKYIGYMYPYRAFYPEFRIAATRGAINSSPMEDFYLVPSEFGEDDQAVFRALINPMIWWMWASGPILVFGTLVALVPRRRSKNVQLRLTSLTARVGDQNQSSVLGAED